MRKIKKKVEVDYTPYHVRQQAWHMSLLKFYSEIEFDEKTYIEFATRLINNKIPHKVLQDLDKLRRIANEKKKAHWDKIKKQKATNLGLQFRKIHQKIQNN
jgi:hypothetical protein